MNTIWTWITLAVLILATFGTLLPILPGLPLIAITIIFYGWIEGFKEINTLIITVTIILTLIGMALDYISGPYSVKKIGGTKAGIIGSIIGGLVGIFILGPFGLLMGPFIGAIVGEFVFGQSISKAITIGFGSLIGIVLSNIVKFIIAATITIIFIINVII